MNIRKFGRSLLYPLLIILMNSKGEGLMGGAGGGEGAGGEGNKGGEGEGGAGDEGNKGGEGAGGEGGEGGEGGDSIVYPEGYDDSLKGNAVLQRYYDKDTKQFSINKLSKALINANSLISSEKIAKPNSKWSDDQWRQHALDSGLPAHIDGYTLENKGLPEGSKADDRFLNAFKEKAYSLGLQSKAAEGLLEWYNGQQVENTKMQDTLATQSFNDGVAQLTREYGNGLKGALQRGEHALGVIASQDEIKTMQETGLLDDPNFSRFLIKVADAFKEEVFDDSTVTSHGMTPAQASEKLAEMAKPDSVYNTTRDPVLKASLREEFSKLAAIKRSVKKSGQGKRQNAMM